MTDRVCVLSVNRLLARALGPPIEARGFALAESVELTVGRPFVHVIAMHDDNWRELRGDDPLRLGCVALIDTPKLELVRRAYQEGAAVITSDLEPDVAADIVAARAAGDVRVPAGTLAGLLGTRSDSLSPREQAVLVEALRGQSVARIAETIHYSDRHVRRILNTVLTKAGTRDLVGAARFFEIEPP